MFKNATPKKAIAFTRCAVALTFCWPLPLSATKTEVLRFQVVRTILFVNSSLLILPLLNALRVYREDPESVAKTACLTLAVAQTILQTVFFVNRYELLQRLIEEMKACCDQAQEFEEDVYQSYVNKYSPFYGISAFWFYSTAFVVVLGTLLISDPFPTNAVYPFPVDYEPMRSFIFAHQSLVGLQCAAHVCANIFCALLLLFSAARFEALTVELRSIDDRRALIKCVRKYYIVHRYAKEAVEATKFIVSVSVIAKGVACLFCGISLIGGQPFTVKIQFLSIAMTSLLEVFMCAWPADHLIDASENVMQAVYSSIWYERPLEIQKSMLLMLTPKTTVIVNIKCVVPSLSLNYYCTYVRNLFSVFAALRVIMLEEKDNKE